MTVSELFVGAGWSFFPLRTDVTGAVALVRSDREIEEAIRIILSTAQGERPMRPEFGCGIHNFVFAPANAATAGQIAFEVRSALDRWEPRIDVHEVVVSFNRADEGELHIDISYTIRGGYDPRNLVFPFYVIPDHPTVLPSRADEQRWFTIEDGQASGGVL
jgi:phage baseplate assembly protein W